MQQSLNFLLLLTQVFNFFQLIINEISHKSITDIIDFNWQNQNEKIWIFWNNSSGYGKKRDIHKENKKFNIYCFYKQISSNIIVTWEMLQKHFEHGKRMRQT